MTRYQEGYETGQIEAQITPYPGPITSHGITPYDHGFIDGWNDYVFSFHHSESVTVH